MPYKDNILFIHIPKTGGTTINKIMGIKNKKEHLFSEKMPILQHLTPLQVKALIGSDAFIKAKKVTVIREPLERAISDYLWMKNRIPLNSFKEYLDLAKKVIDLNLYDSSKYYNHFRPQSHFFVGINYDKVIDFNNFKDEVKDWFGVDKVPRLNRSKTETPITIKDSVRHEAIYHEDYRLYYSFQS